MEEEEDGISKDSVQAAVKSDEWWKKYSDTDTRI